MPEIIESEAVNAIIIFIVWDDYNISACGAFGATYILDRDN